MSNNCSLIVFSNKAYNAIIRESFDKDPVETGGILLGHVLNNGVWIVMEVLPPGIDCIFERAYFEYDDAFVNYLAQSVANQYKTPLELLGLWHRHPGSMDFFSSTDDQTNTTFALQSSAGVISGLVNIDPVFRLTMYHLDNPRMTMVNGRRPDYDPIDIEVGDDIIPEEYFELRYYDGDGSNLNPSLQRDTRQGRASTIQSQRERNSGAERTDSQPTVTIREEGSDGVNHSDRPSLGQQLDNVVAYIKSHTSLLIIILLFFFGLSIKYAWKYVKPLPEQTIEWIKSRASSRDNKESSDSCGIIKGIVTPSKAETEPATETEAEIEPEAETEAEIEPEAETEPEEIQPALDITNGSYSEECQLSVGKDHKLGLKTTNIEESQILWESSEPDVVSVSTTGKLRGIKKGKATVYAKYKELSDSIKITVK